MAKLRSVPPTAPAAKLVLDPHTGVLRTVALLRVPALVAFATLAAVNLVAIAANPWTFPFGHHHATIAFEGGPWTWLSVGLLLATALVVHAATRRRADHSWWSAVAAVFAYLAVDEGLMVHERFDDLAGITGLDHYGWAIPGSILVLGIAGLFARWFFSLESGLRLRLLVAGGTYLAGALVVEVLAGMWQTSHGEDRVFFLITTIEETLEVVGPMLVIRTMFSLAPRSPVVADTPPAIAPAPLG